MSLILSNVAPGFLVNDVFLYCYLSFVRGNFPGMGNISYPLESHHRIKIWQFCLHLYCFFNYKKESPSSEMFKVKHGASSYPHSIPLGVIQENTLIWIIFEKFWLMFSPNSRVDRSYFNCPNWGNFESEIQHNLRLCGNNSHKLGPFQWTYR